MTFPCARALLRYWPLPCLIVVLALSHLGYAEDAKPAADPHDARYAPRLTEIEQKIEAALAKKVNLNYIDTPLKDIVADLAKQVDLPISISEDGLNEAGVVAKKAMTLNVGNVSLREGLRVLDILHELGYVPTATGLRITSRDMMQERLVVRVYPVEDLVPKDTDDLEEINEMYSGFCGAFAIVSEYDALIDSVVSHLAPDSWTDNGGDATISRYQGSLAVSQTLPVHPQLAQFLAAHRRAQREHAARKSVASIVSASDSQTREALNQRISAATDTDLQSYVRDFSKLTGIPVVLDSGGLEAVAVQEDVLIHAAYRDVQAGQALRQVLEEHGLAPALLEECVIITSQYKAQEVGIKTRLYPVSDLVARQDEILDFGSLIDLVTATVQPDAWVDNGGTGAITGLLDPPALVVSVHADMHAEIEKLLADLRANGAPSILESKQKPADRIVQKVYPLYVARRELQAKIASKVNETEKAEEKKNVPVVGLGPSEGDAKVLRQFGGFYGGNVAGSAQYQIADPVPSSEEVAKLIEEMLPDITWEAEGMLLRPFHDVLIIRQRPAMHRKIEKLLRDIDAWHGEAYNLLPIGSH